MDLLKYPVSALPKVGPAYKKLLENLEIFTVEDLLNHVPFRYDDFSDVKNIKDVIENETVTLRGTLGPVDNIFTRNGKKLTKASLIDSTGKINLVWFNQHYLKKVLVTGATYSASGKVGKSGSQFSLLAPELEEEKEGTSLNTGRLVPIYPETQGVNSKWFRSRINDILNKVKTFDDPLPESIVLKNKLKSFEWAINKIHFPEDKSQARDARYRLAFNELFFELLKVESRKQDWYEKRKSHALKPFETETKKFIKTLPFELTDSQQQSVDEIVADLQRSRPMNRMLEGDVGTGKTIVAVIASYLTSLNGFKTVYIAPTEILAQQHFETFSKFMKKVTLLTGSSKKVDVNADVIIGTHALLFNEEIFDKTALIIIDEQHRFGVEQRGKLLQLGEQGKTPHLLTMTATPIPRTLALTIYGDLNMSVLKTHPKNERKITTKIADEKNREQIYTWIKEKNQPTFIVCPFIEVSEAENLENVKAAEQEFAILQKTYLKGVKMGLIHGRMKSAEKQKVIDQFKKGEIKVLVATPVIEVGIDIPDATIIVIEGGERYGLASLHQLRGRVGRDGSQGFCFVFMSTYSSKAHERLKHLETINTGFELAEVDMRMRGQGDIFSTMQHGFKKYKVATLDDFVLLERAKKAVEDIFPTISNYPELMTKAQEVSNPRVKNN
jgi:ATP-dependent DNA helicase RecG